MISIQFSGIDEMKEAAHAYLLDQQNRLRLACIEIAHFWEQFAITNHPWTVRTQATNLTTKGTFDEIADDLYEVVLSAGMDYDVYLEGKRDDGSDRAPMFSKWAWLWPTVVATQDEVMAILAGHLKH